MGTTRYIYVVFIAAAFAVGLATTSAATSAIVMADATDMLIGGFLKLSTLIGVGTGVLTAVVLLKNAAAVRFTSEVVGELAKVSWPSREETTNNSITVIIATLIFSGSLAVFDFVWLRVTESILFR